MVSVLPPVPLSSPAPLESAFEGSRPMKYGVLLVQFTVMLLLPVVLVADEGTDPSAISDPEPAATLHVASIVMVISKFAVVTSCADTGRLIPKNTVAPSAKP